MNEWVVDTSENANLFYIEILRKILNNTVSLDVSSIYKNEVLAHKITPNLNWFWDKNLINWTRINSRPAHVSVRLYLCLPNPSILQ